jgi:hypothetical protein
LFIVIIMRETSSCVIRTFFGINIVIDTTTLVVARLFFVKVLKTIL